MQQSHTSSRRPETSSNDTLSAMRTLALTHSQQAEGFLKPFRTKIIMGTTFHGPGALKILALKHN